MNTSPGNRMALVWDLPTRLFHWGLALVIGAAWATQELGSAWMQAHLWIGYSAAALVLFRVAWGLVGPRHARFADFLAGPRAVGNYLRAWMAGTPPRVAGHNPAGGWTVMVMLVLVVAQVVTGMLNADDALNAGPWHFAVPAAVSDAAHELHETLFDLLLAVIAVHVAAVLAYRLRLGIDLVGPMITGRKQGAGQGIDGSHCLRAVLVLAAAVATVALIVALAPPPDPADLGIF